MQERSGFLLGFMCLVAALAGAQTLGGSLRGIVNDANGAAIPAASIKVHLNASSVERAVASDGRGGFRMDDLPPGAYRITVTAPGFADAVADVKVAISSVRDISVRMKPSAVVQTVNVQAQSSSITSQAIDLASQVHQSVITSQDLEELPLPARSFANIAYLAPGTEPVEPSDPTKARITAVSTGGSSGLNNELSVDGGDNSDDYIGGFLQNFSPDSIQEFAVRTSQEDADTGGTTAGSVVITTRTRHQPLAWRCRLLRARRRSQRPLPDREPRAQSQAALLAPELRRHRSAGPSRKTGLTFTAFEGVHEDASIAYSPASLTQFDALATLAAEGLIPGVSSIAVPSNVPIPFRDYLGTAALRLVAVLANRSGSCAPRPTPTPPTTTWSSREPYPPPACSPTTTT